MILPFMQHFPKTEHKSIAGKPTHFVEKIWEGLKENELIAPGDSLEATDRRYYEIFEDSPFDYTQPFRPKIQTIRDDVHNRWNSSRMIDYYINNQRPNMFQFAPRVKVQRVQKVFMSYKYNDLIEISVGSKYLFGYAERLEFAFNDGFDTWEDFFDYWYPRIQKAPNQFYKGKLIQWTGFRYE